MIREREREKEKDRLTEERIRWRERERERERGECVKVLFVLSPMILYQDSTSDNDKQ